MNPVQLRANPYQIRVPVIVALTVWNFSEFRFEIGTNRCSVSLDPMKRLGLNRRYAAFYVGVSTAVFDQMVTEGRMPSPKRIGDLRLWDRRDLEAAFAALPDETTITLIEDDPYADVEA